MADPISILAIAGLAYVGKKLSDPKPEKYQVVSENTNDPYLVQEEVPNIAAPRPIGLDNLPASKMETTSLPLKNNSLALVSRLVRKFPPRVDSNKLYV
jgi:hypothetical protein